MSSLAVANPEIDEVLDLETGLFHPASDFIGDDIDALMKLRMTLREDLARQQKRYVCPLCLVPVYLVTQKERERFFLRHHHEDGGCPVTTRGELSERQILALKFDGAKESKAHQHLKQLVAESLLQDPLFTDIQIESVWKSVNGERWRKPDVRARYRGLPVAFEIQLSTTFIRVIAERRAFYQDEGGLLVWIFGSFEDVGRRLTEDDVFYNNNRNAFTVSTDTLQASISAHAFRLECAWSEPGAAAGAPLQRAQVGFADLVLDKARQRAYYFDYDGAVEARKRAEADAVRRYFHQLIAKHLDSHNFALGDWKDLSRKARKCGLELPEYPSGLPWTLIKFLLSARARKPVGFKFKSFIQVAHQVYPGHRNYLRYFRHALAKTPAQGHIQDKSGQWAKKVAEYTPLLAARDPAFVADTSHLVTLNFLFPELDLMTMDIGEPLAGATSSP